MKLPPLMLVTSRHQMRHTFEFALESALLGGASLIQLREKDLQPALYSYLAQIASQLCHKYRATLLINSPLEKMQPLADGQHFPEAILQRDTVPTAALKGVSVHSVENARLAQEKGADYVVFGSVFATGSHPESMPGGLEALHAVASAVQIPVYAIGGISEANAQSCIEAGAHGVAVMSAVWSADDVMETVRNFQEILL